MDTTAWDVGQAKALIEREVRAARAFLGDDGADQSALLPILQALQHHFGFVPPEAVAVVADALNLSKAEVKGVVSFYKDLRTSPPGEHVVALCRAEACQARGAEAVAAHLERTHGLAPGGTSHGVTLTNTYCLGNCALGPAALIDDTKLVGRLDLHAADALVASLTPGGKS
ncbi:MAG: NAD(P)H-dependent oxidoreductase subunit E [Myxococcaceae bacterium]|nr:NAD(P)H-dependent oxidoreductase subunit E [Myxococcaceae bacterium]